MSVHPHVRSDDQRVRAIVEGIYRDLVGRAGCRWDGVDHDIQQEILDAWVAIAERALDVDTPPPTPTRVP